MNPKWVLEVENWVRGSPSHIYLTAKDAGKDGLSKVEVVRK
jgi:hypothetical protein